MFHRGLNDRATTCKLKRSAELQSLDPSGRYARLDILSYLRSDSSERCPTFRECEEQSGSLKFNEDNIVRRSRWHLAAELWRFLPKPHTL